MILMKRILKKLTILGLNIFTACLFFGGRGRQIYLWPYPTPKLQVVELHVSRADY